MFDGVDKRQWIDVLLPSYGLICIVIALDLVRLTHPHEAYKHSKVVWPLRIIILIVMCVMPLFAMQINQAIIFLVMFLCIVSLVLLDIEGRARRKEIKAEMKKERQACASKQKG